MDDAINEYRAEIHRLTTRLAVVEACAAAEAQHSAELAELVTAQRLLLDRYRNNGQGDIFRSGGQTYETYPASDYGESKIEGLA